MSYSNQTTTTKSASEGYQVILKVLPEQGFTISRRRDLANLAQGQKKLMVPPERLMSPARWVKKRRSMWHVCPMEIHQKKKLPPLIVYWKL